MRKWIYALVALIVVGLGFGWYQYEYGGQSYYTKITTKGERQVRTADNGDKYIDYQYKLPAYNKAGDKRTVDFNGNKERPLKRNAYLQLKVSRQKGMISWQAVTKGDVPAKATAKLDE